MSAKFRTTLVWDDSDGNEIEAAVTVEYARHKGFAGDRTDPPEPESVEIQSIVADSGVSVPDSFLTDPETIAECMDDWWHDECAASEYRAEQRRDDAMMDRLS